MKFFFDVIEYFFTLSFKLHTIYIVCHDIDESEFTKMFIDDKGLEILHPMIGEER